MGNSIVHSYIKSNLLNKRKASVFDSDLESDNNGEFYDADENYDKKRKMKRNKKAKTSKYIYKTLFEEQQGSDVTIKALNKTWNLHKLYLSQSPYFYTMFNGNWLETQKKEIELQIEDDNITIEALHKVFSSFYQDEIQIDPKEAVPIISAASLLQMDEICHQCIEVMKHNINKDTVISYYDAAEFYSLKKLKDISFDWLLKNLLHEIKGSPIHLKEISCDLMTELVSSSNLVVIQTEFTIYMMLKVWLYLKENECTLYGDNTEQFVKKDVNNYFRIRAGRAYLLSSSGQAFQKPFLAMRRQHLLCHTVDIQVIEIDNIMPMEWFDSIFKHQWLSMLQIDEGIDTGPSDVSYEDFKKHSTRVGRILKQDKETTWRWTGFNYGLDLIVHYKKGSIYLTRYKDFLASQSNEMENTLEHFFKDKKRLLMYRIAVHSHDKKGKLIHKQETGIERVSLGYCQEKHVLDFDCQLKFPVLFSVYFLVTTPSKDIHQENLILEEVQTAV